VAGQVAQGDRVSATRVLADAAANDIVSLDTPPAAILPETPPVVNTFVMDPIGKMVSAPTGSALPRD
jgi:hypothetical protein